MLQVACLPLLMHWVVPSLPGARDFAGLSQSQGEALVARTLGWKHSRMLKFCEECCARVVGISRIAVK